MRKTIAERQAKNDRNLRLGKTCVKCGRECTLGQFNEFFCPCDLHHAVCDSCSKTITRFDCAYI